MIVIQTKVHVDRIGTAPIFNYLINPSDAAYQEWWPGVHLQFHNIRSTPNIVGNIIYMDEFVGRRRMRMTAVVIEAQPDKKIVWQFKQIILLPVWLCIELDQDGHGVALTHTILAGFRGIGRILDSIFRLYFSEPFVRAMDEHARIEFPKLGELLASTQPLK